MEHLDRRSSGSSRAHIINNNGVSNNSSIIRGSLACGALAPLHDQLSFTPFPSWKLCENYSYADGQLVPKYMPRYLNPPLHRGANSFTTAANSLTLAANCDAQDQLNLPPPHPLISANCDAQDQLNLPPPHPLISAQKLAASFWEHNEIHRLAQAEEPVMPSDLAYAQAQQPNLPPPTTLKCPPLHLDCKISHAAEDKTEPEEAINMTSNQATLANILHRVRYVEENQSRSMAMVAKLRLEMEDVSSRIQELEFSHKSALREINSLLQRFGEQMTISRKKEQEKMQLAFLHLREEIEEDRSACRLLKIQNKKLAKDLTEANVAAANACEELDRERKARELLEEVCNELAREIGEDKAEVEQLKQEQANSRERVEEELKMMRIAALWREERVRTKISEAQLELNGKQYMSWHDLKSKLEAFVSTVGAMTREGSQEDIENQVKQAKMLRQALELLQLEDERETHDKAYQNDEDIVDDLEQIKPGKEAKRPRKVRRPQASAEHRYNVSIRQQNAYDHRPNAAFLEVHENWHTSDNEVEGKQLSLHDVAHPEMGDVLERNIDEHNHVHASSAEEDDNRMWTLATDQKKQMKQVSSGCDTSEQIKESSCNNLEQSLSNALNGMHRKHSSLHFDVVGGQNHQLDDDMGPSLHHSFSEDDASYVAAGGGERQRKQKALDAMRSLISITKQEEGIHQWEYKGHEERRNDDDDHRHGHLDHAYDHESAGGEGDDSELDDFYFEPVRAPSNSLVNKISYVDDQVNLENRDYSSTDLAQITAKLSSQSSSKVTKVHGPADGSPSTTARSSQELHIKGAANSSSQEPIKMATPANSFQLQTSPWRSASGKPLQCFWPPSPEAFSIFGGASKRSKANILSGRQMEVHSHKPSSTPEATEQEKEHHHHHPKPQKLLDMKSNSLRAQLLKARELENEKPAKASFRFSPLRRPTSG